MTHAWIQRKLGEVVKVNSGRDYKHLNAGDIPVYGTGGYMLSVDESLSDADAIGIGRKGTIDKPQLLSAPFWTVDTLFFMTTLNDNDLLFLFSLCQNIEWAKMDESTGVPSLSKINIENVNIYATDNAEQQQIGNFFRTLDNTIALYQRKLDGLKKLKQGYLQQMFPQTGEKVPRLRFAGFTGDWTDRKLGEVGEFYSGGTPSVGDKRYYGGEIPFIRSAEINAEKTEIFITDEGLKNSAAKMVNIGTILYALYGATSGEVGRSQINGAINQAILAIKPTEKYCSEYIYQWLKNQKKNIVSIYLQGGQGNLSAAIVKELNIEVPYITEQIAIGKFFRNLDTQIAHQQTKLDKLKHLKAAYLQKMFA